MNSIGVILVILLVASISVIIKKYAAEYSLFINIFLGFAVILYLISNFMPIFNQMKSLIDIAKVPEKYSCILFKSLGICFITQFASDCCTDAKETSLASKIEIIGKLSIIAVSLPLFEEIIGITLDFMGAK